MAIADQPFAVRGIVRLIAREGRIASFREYLDPIALAQLGRPRQLLRRFYDAMQAKSADALAELYAPAGIHQYGFAVPNRPHRLVGREAIRASYTEGWRNHPLDIESIDDELVVAGADPEIVVGQWRGRAHHKGEPVSLTGLLILRVRAGEIVHGYDYMDALGVARAVGRLPFGEKLGAT